MAITDAGESRAWELLTACDPAGVSARALVEYDPGAGLYRLRSFGRPFAIAPGRREILSLEPGGEMFLSRLAYFFRLSVLWYLVKASAAPPAERLLRPSSLPGAATFFQGSHVLPLEPLARRYAASRTEFLRRGAEMGAEKVAFGDAAVVLHPVPKIPVTLILWSGDEEFPARADLLFDASAPAHLPLDLLWSVAMMSALVFL